MRGCDEATLLITGPHDSPAEFASQPESCRNRETQDEMWSHHTGTATNQRLPLVDGANFSADEIINTR